MTVNVHCISLINIICRLIYADKHAIVLEDLNELGYELANRKQRLDVERTKKLLSKLAQFHATTAVLYSKVR